MSYNPFIVSIQFSDLESMHRVEQPAPQSNFRAFPTTPKELFYPFAISPCYHPAGAGNHIHTFHL